MRSVEGLRAYQQSSARRSIREQEADVFRRVNATLRSCPDDDILARARAVADNDRLWISVMDLVRDPANALPAPLRASILSVGWAVRRETAAEKPDLDFIIAINENVAAGLASR